jgi:hypothetical protein
MLCACGGSGSSPQSSPDASASADAADETIVITSDATAAVDSGDGSSPDGARDAGDSSVESSLDSSAESSLDSGSEASPPVTVTGHVVIEGSWYSTSAPQPIASRKVTIVDANGVRTDVTTDGSGAFTVSDVVTPYDAVVAAGPSAQGNPVAFLGLSTPDPRLMGWADSTSGQNPYTATVKVVVQEPSCGSASCIVDIEPYDCSFTGEVAFASGESGGYTTATTQSFSVPIEWTGLASACAGFNVLVSDSTFSHFWYGQTAANVSQGATPTTSTLALNAIPTVGMLTMVVSESALDPSSWGQPALAILFNYPAANGGGFAPLPSLNGGTSLVTGVPDIVGATVSVQADIDSSNAATPDPSLRQGVSATGNDLPLTTTSVNLTLDNPLALSSPAENGALSAASGTLAWSWSSSGELMYVRLVSFGDGSVVTEAEVYSGAAEIPLARLTRAGVELVSSPQHALFDTFGKIASLDAFVDEMILARPDGSRGETANIAFTMTP